LATCLFCPWGCHAQLSVCLPAWWSSLHWCLSLTFPVVTVIGQLNDDTRLQALLSSGVLLRLNFVRAIAELCEAPSDITLMSGWMMFPMELFLVGVLASHNSLVFLISLFLPLPSARETQAFSLSHWLGIACRKCGFSMKVVGHPKGQQLGL
jgi:hypothetical protein